MATVPVQLTLTKEDAEKIIEARIGSEADRATLAESFGIEKPKTFRVWALYEWEPDHPSEVGAETVDGIEAQIMDTVKRAGIGEILYGWELITAESPVAATVHYGDKIVYDGEL